MRIRSCRYCVLFGFLLFQTIWLLALITFSTPTMQQKNDVTIQSHSLKQTCKCNCNKDTTLTSNKSGTTDAVTSDSNKKQDDTTCGTPPPSSLTQPKENCFLFVLILSSPNGRDQRDTIRQTWMKDYSELIPKVLVKFSIGTLGLSQFSIDRLHVENKEFKDLLLLKDLQESYHNLSIKVLKSFVHIDQTFLFTYLFKGDDDTFILLNTVLQELTKRESKTSFYWGFFNGRARPKRKGKWKETGWFLSDRYLPYALGGGYIVTNDLIHYIALVADGLQLYHSEDVSVGVWLSGFKAERRHDVRFNTEFVSRGCRNIYIVSHKQSMADMRKKYENLKQIGVQCEREFQTRPSYIYNWTVPPSECCDRKFNIP